MTPTNCPKVVLITGAAKRIGAVIAKKLHQQGMNIIIHYRSSQKEAERLCYECNHARSNSAVTLQADLAQENYQQLVQEALTPWGRLDVLINNASSFYPTALGKITPDAWNELMATNLKAPFFLAQAAQADLAKQQGCIINIIDVHAFKPLRNYGVYCIAKAGLVMLTQVLAKEMAPKIRVNGIAPGPSTLWPEGEHALEESKKTQILTKIPLQRMGTPTAIAAAALFFMEQDYITGQVLGVDGGRSIV